MNLKLAFASIQLYCAGAASKRDTALALDEAGFFRSDIAKLFGIRIQTVSRYVYLARRRRRTESAARARRRTTR